MKPPIAETNEELDDPLWLRIVLRLLCGIVVAAILGAIGYWHSQKTGMVSGATFGFLCGFGFGESALMSIFSGYIMSGGNR